MRKLRAESGFSLIELLFATGLLLVVSSIVTNALMQMTQSQKTIWNRTEMHSGIRGATELLQQEVGQAGRATLPTGVVTVTADAVTGLATTPTACSTQSPTLSSVTGMWAGASDGILLTFVDGDNSETVRVTALPGGNKITGCFWRNHAINAPVRALGGFATGIIPPSGVTNPSTATVLKLHGDINGDGNMMYVEYTCDTVSHNLYRNAMAFTTTVANKPALNDSKILLGNIQPNPGGTDCFSYQTSTPIIVGGTSYTFVLDVAITLTVETQEIDPLTRRKQTETKALLNVSPRNVFHAWSFAGMAYNDRVQATPPSVVALLAPVTP